MLTSHLPEMLWEVMRGLLFGHGKTLAASKILSLVILIVVSVVIPFVAVSRSVTTAGETLSVSEDYQLWVQPYLSQIEKVRAVLMTPYTIGNQHYGYDNVTGLVRGGNIEPSPAIGVPGGYNDVVVAIDNNLEGSASLDYFNSASSPLSGQPGFAPVSTNIYGDVRGLLAKTWVGVGGCSAPFTQYSYPSSFSLLDRREAEYGTFDPYYSTLIKPGNHLGGIGTNCGTEGQTWYLPGYDSLPTSPTKPLIATEFPSGSPIPNTGDLEELSFYIDEMYLQCRAGTVSCSLWQNAYLNAMSQYPFAAPREALHFIQASRATAAWTLSNMTYNGMSAYQMLQDTINRIWSSAVGPDGGLYQSFDGGASDRTPEPNFQAMIAFDPRMPSWFDQDTGYPSTSTTASTSTTTTTLTSTLTSTTTSDTTSTTSSTSTTSTDASSSSTSTSSNYSSTTSKSSTSTSLSGTTSTVTVTTTSALLSTVVLSSTIRLGTSTSATSTSSTTTSSDTLGQANSVTTSQSTETISPTTDSTLASETSGRQEITNSSLSSALHATSQSVETSTSFPTYTNDTSRVSGTAPPSSPSHSRLYVNGNLQSRNGRYAAVVGGFASLETFVVGLIPVALFANGNEPLWRKKFARKEWIW